MKPRSPAPPDSEASFETASEPCSGLSPARIRRIPATGEIARAWRRLTSGATPARCRTLVACSGGADSTALLLALHSTCCLVDVVHVIHTMRARDRALADRDAVRDLAATLGIRFFEADLAAEPAPAGLPSNPEAAARRMRYDAMARLASRLGCGFVATGHHADDQLESVLMALMRGSGTAGLRGLAEARPLLKGKAPCAPDGVTLIRPMLTVSHAQACELCDQAGVAWREDTTNADTSRLRSALRHRVLPLLEELRPGTAQRASHSAVLLRDAHELVQRDAERVLRRAALPCPPGFRRNATDLVWERSALRTCPSPTLGLAMRLAFASLTSECGLDALPARSVDDLVRVISSGSGESKYFEWPSGVRVLVDRETVSMERVGAELV